MEAHLTSSDTRTLEQSRRQLVQLSHSIRSLEQSILSNPTLPSIESFNLQTEYLVNRLKDILAHLDKEENREVFEKVVAYPSTNFPGREEVKEEVLRSLLRKKLEPDVEAWINEGKRAGEQIEEEGKGEEQENITEVWKDIREWFDERARKFAEEEANVEYTNEEEEMGIENVNTGLKKSYGVLRSDNGEDTEEEEAETVVLREKEVVEEKTLEDVVRLWTTGQVESWKQDNSHMVRKRW